VLNFDGVLRFLDFGLCTSITVNCLSHQIYTRALHYAIIDEADSILIDEAVNPLILGELELLGEDDLRKITFADMVNNSVLSYFVLRCCYPW
jgi:hypothetical protein